jgi:hypothetical protein
MVSQEKKNVIIFRPDDPHFGELVNKMNSLCVVLDHAKAATQIGEKQAIK